MSRESGSPPASWYDPPEDPNEKAREKFEEAAPDDAECPEHGAGHLIYDDGDEAWRCRATSGKLAHALYAAADDLTRFWNKATSLAQCATGMGDKVFKLSEALEAFDDQWCDYAYGWEQHLKHLDDDSGGPDTIEEARGER